MIERRAADLQRAFPGVSGFFARSIWRMRAFYLAYTQEVTNLAKAVPDLDGVNLPQLAAELEGVNLPQVAAEIVAFRSARRRLFAERTTTLRARAAQVEIA